MSHLSTITGWQCDTVALPILRLDVTSEYVPDDFPEDIDEASTAVRCFELGRKIGQINATEQYVQGFVFALDGLTEKCPRKHSYDHRRRHGLRPPSRPNKHRNTR